MADAITIPKFIEATDDLFIYSQSNGVAQPGATTQAQMQEFIRNNSDVLKCLVSFLWQPQTQYVVNDVIKSPNMPAGLVAKVTKAGTTSSSEPSWSSTIGATINDGSVIYTMLQEVNSIATSAQLQAGIDNSVIVTPAGLRTARPLKTYIDWAQLDLDENTNTFTDLVSALPNGSMFINFITNQNYQAMELPARGFLLISKENGNILALLRAHYTNNGHLWFYTPENGGTWKCLATSDVMPVGTILPFAGGSIPSGFLACNGAAVRRTTYSNLFSAIGTTYGSGDGSTTFNLPNLEDNRFLEFASTAGAKKNAGLPNITGGPLSTGIGGTANSDITWNGSLGTQVVNQNTNSRDGGTSPYYGAIQSAIDASKSNSIYGGSTTVQPKSLTVRAIIKY